MSLTVAVLGKGGREHALAWKVQQSQLVEKVFVAPGNAGMERFDSLETFNFESFNELASQGKEKGIDLFIIGPEQYLEDGVTDFLQKKGFLVFGPSQKLAKLESSKAFAKEVLEKTQVPTAQTLYLGSPKDALGLEFEFPVVFKLDGLEQGKGVVIVHNQTQAQEVLKQWQTKEKLLVEEFLQGVELSCFALCSGESFLYLGEACDYKALKENDQGPNTGGMGTFSPVPWVSDEIRNWVEAELFTPVLKELQSFRGILFAGLMITKKGPYVLEFNVRLGDPETQVLLPQIEDDLMPFLLHVAQGKDLTNQKLKRKKKSFLHLVAASPGYPSHPQVGHKITLPSSLQSKIFAAGVKEKEGVLETAGGRVLGLTGEGENLEKARKLVFQEMEKVKFQGKVIRSDIGLNRPAPQWKGRMTMALMVSGRGSNALNLLKYFQDHPGIKFSCLISNNPEAPILKKVQNIPVHVEQDEKKIIELLQAHQVSWVCLAGFMRLLSPSFLKEFWDEEKRVYRVINIHPSYLPLHPGLNAYQKSFEDENPFGGASVHFVDEGVDSGPVIVQEKFDKAQDFEKFQEDGLKLEHQIYPQAIEEVFQRYYQ